MPDEASPLLGRSTSPVFTIHWDNSMGCYRVSVPNLDPAGIGVEVVRVVDLVSAGVVERLTGLLMAQQVQVIQRFNRPLRDEYMESLHEHVRTSLAAALGHKDPLGGDRA